MPDKSNEKVIGGKRMRLQTERLELSKPLECFQVVTCVGNILDYKCVQDSTHMSLSLLTYKAAVVRFGCRWAQTERIDTSLLVAILL
jgi:hypothetical protein